ncbi:MULTISPECIES: lytic transglycosylase [unclassified Pseudomonas]|uniref:lytic transglycosylase n=1 Tax=unclassified Pseudomonas TaxID=196821 RepID=UPI00384A64D2
METVKYCQTWSRIKKEMVGPLSEEEAASLHSSNNSYTALIGGGRYPACFIEMVIDKAMVGVGFLDEMGRVYLTYQFQVVANGKIFLTMATWRKFDGEGDKVLSGESYIFSESGELVIRRNRMVPYEVEEANATFDPAGNYENIPVFGDYSAVIKVER